MYISLVAIMFPDVLNFLSPLHFLSKIFWICVFLRYRKFSCNSSFSWQLSCFWFVEQALLFFCLFVLFWLVVPSLLVAKISVYSIFLNVLKWLHFHWLFSSVYYFSKSKHTTLSVVSYLKKKPLNFVSVNQRLIYLLFWQIWAFLPLSH